MSSLLKKYLSQLINTRIFTGQTNNLQFPLHDLPSEIKDQNIYDKADNFRNNDTLMIKSSKLTRIISNILTDIDILLTTEDALSVITKNISNVLEVTRKIVNNTKSSSDGQKANILMLGKIYSETHISNTANMIQKNSTGAVKRIYYLKHCTNLQYILSKQHYRHNLRYLLIS